MMVRDRTSNPQRDAVIFRERERERDNERERENIEQGDLDLEANNSQSSGLGGISNSDSDDDDRRRNNFLDPSRLQVSSRVSRYCRRVSWSPKRMLPWIGAVILFLTLSNLLSIRASSRWWDITITVVLIAAGLLVVARFIGQRARQLQLQIERSHSMQNMRLSLTQDRLRLLLTDRDFDANDYENLLALDEDMNHGKAGLQNTELDRFPIYSMPARVDNLEDVGQETYRCSICLDLLMPGDVARLLPCMHQFHADCVDKWLLTDARCPVCKIEL